MCRCRSHSRHMAGFRADSRLPVEIETGGPPAVHVQRDRARPHARLGQPGRYRIQGRRDVRSRCVASQGVTFIGQSSKNWSAQPEGADTYPKTPGIPGSCTCGVPYDGSSLAAVKLKVRRTRPR